MSARKLAPKFGTFQNPCLDSPLVDNRRFGWDELRRLQEAWHNPQCAFVRICCVCVCVCVCVCLSVCVLCFCCIAFGTTAIADRNGMATDVCIRVVYVLVCVAYYIVYVCFVSCLIRQRS